jgi:hypothetical protein
VAKANSRVSKDAGIVRTAMRQNVAHAFQLADVNAASRIA